MIIYIEGVDGSGKSTLADNIEKNFKAKDINCNRNAESEISTNPGKENRINADLLFEKLEEMAKSDVVNILDRGPISDCIYRMYDDYEPVSDLKSYIDFFKRYKEQVLIIFAKTKNAEKLMLERGDDNPVAIRHHKEISKAYDSIMAIINLALQNKVILFDWTKPKATEHLLHMMDLFVAKNMIKQISMFDEGGIK